MDYGKVPLCRRTRTQTALFYRKLWEEKNRSSVGCSGGSSDDGLGRKCSGSGKRRQKKRSINNLGSGTMLDSTPVTVLSSEEDKDMNVVETRSSGINGLKKRRVSVERNCVSRKIQKRKTAGLVRDGLTSRKESLRKSKKHRFELSITEAKFLNEVAVSSSWSTERGSGSGVKSNVDYEKGDRHDSMEDDDAVAVLEKMEKETINDEFSGFGICKEMVESEISADREESKDAGVVELNDVEHNYDTDDCDFEIDEMSSPVKSDSLSEEQYVDDEKEMLEIVRQEKNGDEKVEARMTGNCKSNGEGEGFDNVTNRDIVKNVNLGKSGKQDMVDLKSDRGQRNYWDIDRETQKPSDCCVDNDRESLSDSSIVNTDQTGKIKKAMNVEARGLRHIRVGGLDILVGGDEGNDNEPSTIKTRLRPRSAPKTAVKKLKYGKLSCPIEVNETDEEFDSSSSDDDDDCNRDDNTDNVASEDVKKSNQVLVERVTNDKISGEEGVKKSNQKSLDRVIAKKSKNESKKGHKKKRNLDFLRILTNSILDKGSSTIEEKLGSSDVEVLVQETLPLKFNFDDDVPSPQGEPEWQNELDGLFAELDMALRTSEIGSIDNAQIEDLEDEMSTVSTANCCHKGNHHLVLDEEIGITCLYCSFVQMEINMSVLWEEGTSMASLEKKIAPFFTSFNSQNLAMGVRMDLTVHQVTNVQFGI